MGVNIMDKEYISKKWLNPPSSSFTSTVAAYDKTYDKDGACRSTWLKISDCYRGIHLHPDDDNNIDDFINKLELLKDEISLFIEHLKNT